MPYSASTVGETVNLINRRYFLPAIQRPFVWNSEQIVRLFDSLMKGFPISSFLFWDVRPENKKNWQTYKFIENFRYGELHNEPANLDGLEVSLVLDGQQRLTSLLLGLRGSFTEKTKGKRWDNANAWTTKRLFIDLVVEPDSVYDEDDEEHDEELYGFRLAESLPASLPGQLWIKVGDLLDCRSEEDFTRYSNKQIARLRADSPGAEREAVSRNLKQLHRLIWLDQSISFYTEVQQNYDRVLRIFVRANDAGTKLSKSDLMMSMISARWSDIAAREEIVNLINEINQGTGRRNNLTRDYVIKATLLLSGLDHQYQVRNLTTANLDRMRAEWSNVKRTLRRTFALLNAIGIDEATLTSLNATLPVAQYIHGIGVDLLAADTPTNILNIERIKRWLIAALLNQVFGGSSDSTIAVAKGVVSAVPAGGDFPFLELGSALSKHLKRPSSLTPETIESAMALTYRDRLAFLVLTLLYDDQRWGITPHHIDHIFPKARLDRKALMGTNMPYSKVDEIVAAADRLGNLELLTAPENLEKNAQPFESWIGTRDASFVGRHLIPESEHLRSIQMVPQFVSTREQAIHKRLVRLQFDPAVINSVHEA